MLKERGQVSIYVIIAVIIVVAVILVYIFVPGVKELLGAEQNPGEFLRSCIGDEMQKDVIILSNQGGYANPEGYILYKGNKIKYLCYTSEYYKTCMVQQPFIKKHFEKELEEMLGTKATDCLEELKTNYERRGYEVEVDDISSTVKVMPGKISFSYNSPLVLRKGDNSQRYEEFGFSIDSEIYDLLYIATSIIEYEAAYGDSETSLYMKYYPNLRVEKMKLGDGSTTYKLTNVVSGDYFNFASRSLAWPAGYGTTA